MLAYLLQGLSLGFSGAASPGPFQAFLIGRALSNGWRGTLLAALAPLISDGPIIALMMLVLTQVPSDILRAIQIAGGAYILYLAWKALERYRRFQGVGSSQAGKTLWQAVVANLLSPGPYVFWSILAGPVLVKGWEENPALGLAFLVGFYGAMVSTLALLVVLFGAARRLGSRVNRAMVGLSALALLGFGLYQLLQGVW